MAGKGAPPSSWARGMAGIPGQTADSAATNFASRRKPAAAGAHKMRHLTRGRKNAQMRSVTNRAKSCHTRSSAAEFSGCQRPRRSAKACQTGDFPCQTSAKGAKSGTGGSAQSSEIGAEIRKRSVRTRTGRARSMKRGQLPLRSSHCPPATCYSRLLAPRCTPWCINQPADGVPGSSLGAFWVHPGCALRGSWVDAGSKKGRKQAG